MSSNARPTRTRRVSEDAYYGLPAEKSWRETATRILRMSGRSSHHFPLPTDAVMEPLLRDTMYAGTLLWLAGYLASMAVFFSGLNYDFWGKAVLLLYIPCAAIFAYWYFSGRVLPLRYYAGVGVAWSLIAIVLDFPFIVLRFGAHQYYGPDVYLYYAAMFLIPVGVGFYVDRKNSKKPAG